MNRLARGLERLGHRGSPDPSAALPADVRTPAPSTLRAQLDRIPVMPLGAMDPVRAVDLVLDELTADIAHWAQLAVLDRGVVTFTARARGTDTVTGAVARTLLPEVSTTARLLSGSSAEVVLVEDGERHDSPGLVGPVPLRALRRQLATLAPGELVSVPVRARGEAYAVLTLALRDGAGFEPAALLELERFAHEIGMALDTARLLAESRRVASVLAHGLALPELTSLDDVDLATYHRVAREQDALGGDFYDLVPDPDGEGATVVLGDVRGKGVEAAVLSGRVRQCLRTACFVHDDPAQILELVNRAMVFDDDETFVTLLAAHFRRDEAGLQVRLSSAGHAGPWIIRTDGEATEVPVLGPALGLLEAATYSTVSVQLDAGDVCLMMSDGVAEAPGARGAFGDDRVGETVRATGAAGVHAQVDSLARALTEHVIDRGHDDIAILGFARRRA